MRACPTGLVLASKIAPRAFGGVNSPDPLCARHALAVAALAARDMPGMYVEQMRQLVSNSLEIWHTTGVLRSTAWGKLRCYQDTDPASCMFCTQPCMACKLFMQQP
jgi:hypothetical protein